MAAGLGVYRLGTLASMGVLMARSRNIKPGMFKNEILGVADPLYTLCFQGLWVLADREGRLEDRPLRIKAETFPYREGIDIEAMLDWLASSGFIKRYQVLGNRYIQILNFGKHQNPHKNESASVIPAPDDLGVNTEKIGTDAEVIGATSEKIGSTRADSFNLIPDSLSSDSLTSESNDSGDSAASATPPQSGIEASPMSDKDTVWTLGPALLGDKARSVLGKLVATHGESLVAAVLMDCAREKPGESKSWVIAACASRQQQAKTAPGSTISALSAPTPAWAISAGFKNQFEAENAGCNERNFKQFVNGLKLEAA